MAGPVHIDGESFDEKTMEKPVAIVDFWAAWCGPCRILAPTIEELAEEYGSRILVGKLDVDAEPEIAERFNVVSIPTVVILKNGCEVDRLVGCVPKDSIVNVLKKHLE